MSEMDRRGFIGFVGRACAGTTLAATTTVTAEAQEANATARKPEEPGVYRGRRLAQVAMPMGGLGAGNVAIGGGGNLRNWQIFNQCNPSAQLPATFFALWAKTEGKPASARLLQLDSPGKLPTAQDVEFRGEYPFAWLTYKHDALPLAVTCETYCPFIPLNTRDSGVPGVVFRFRVKNTGREAVQVSLAQTCQNAVGFDGFGSYEECRGNVNHYEKRDSLHLLHLTTQTNRHSGSFSSPVVMLTSSRSAARLSRLFHNVDLRFFPNLSASPKELTRGEDKEIGRQGDREKKTGKDSSLISGVHRQGRTHPSSLAVIDDLEPGGNWDALDTFVAGGGSLLILGGAQLLGAGLPDTTASTDIVYEDFEAKTYDAAKWTVEGDAFGTGPARGTLGGQQNVSGFGGQGLVNTYLNGDAATGKLTSKPFTIERRYIHFLIGGGNHAGQTCINLRVNGKVVRTEVGHDEEHLRPEKWDVGAFHGQQAQIEIVDTRTDAWGHINIDDIVFSDSIIARSGVTPEQKAKIRAFLPFTYTNVARPSSPTHTFNDADAPMEFFGLPAAAQAAGQSVTVADNAILIDFHARPDAVVHRVKYDGQPFAIEWTHGKGRAILLLAGLEQWFTFDPAAVQQRRPEQGFASDGAAFQNRRAFLGSLMARALASPEHTFQSAQMAGEGLASSHPQWGSMALGVSGSGNVTRREQWDTLDAFWQDFQSDGRLDSTPSTPAPPGKTWNGAIASQFTLQAGQETEIVFTLGWHFPNRYRDRTMDVGFGSNVGEYEVKYRLGNMYNNWFADAGAVVAYLHKNDKRLYEETKRFHHSLFDSTLPYVVRDALSSQMAIPRAQTSMWIENGRWVAYEGLGCCPMNCTHVYNYAQTLAKLFPELERNVRDTDLTIQLQEDGGVRHRTQLPLDVPRATGPFTDGHLSTICKAYREHLQSADSRFLNTYWPAVKKAMDYAVRVYDANGDGLVEGRQPNTYDCDVFGHNSFISSQYLAALRAAEEMAREQNEPETAARYHALYEKGRENCDKICWNGEYYQQVFDAYLTTPTQYGPGCHADQVLGQWWAHVVGLGPILSPEKVKTALAAMMKHNFITDFTRWDYHGQRVFANGRDQGLVCCTWPRGGRPEKVAPILYCYEVWTGVEYQVAAHLLYEGMTEDALKIVEALRARYDGIKRNPWNEIECSDHYGRAMASWSLLLAASGYEYHGPKGILRFAPRLSPHDFGSLFTTAQGWGRFTQTRPAIANATQAQSSVANRQNGQKPQAKTNAAQENTLLLDYGTLTLNELRLSAPTGGNGAKFTATAQLAQRTVPTTLHQESNSLHLKFARPLNMKAGQKLTVTVSG